MTGHLIKFKSRPFLKMAPMLCALLFLIFSIIFSVSKLSRLYSTVEPATFNEVATEVNGNKTTLPKGFSLKTPQGLTMRSAVFTREKLYCGKMLLIDEQHPVPAAAPAPNTLSIAAYAGSQVATRQAQTVTEEETLEALKTLFQAGRQKGHGNWTVFAGTRSNAQQLDLQLEQLGIFAQTHSLETAAAMAAKTWERPGCSEHQTGYAVDIRLVDGWAEPPHAEALGASKSGAYLLENAWKYGFIYRYGEKNPHRMAEENYHFRYVGKSNAELMYLLQMTMEEYLALLREKKEIAYFENGLLKYYAVCEEVMQDWLTKVPAEAVTIDVSYDNTGYALAVYGF